jgi:stage III sporulation protein AG
MDLKQMTGKVLAFGGKYRYAVLVLVIGLALLLLPGKGTKADLIVEEIKAPSNEQTIEMEALAEILQSIQGAGKVKVLLSIGAGIETVYQTDTDTSAGNDSGSTRIETVVITDAQRNESGLISQINPPKYLGAIVVCQGADSPAVKFAITQAVSKITGLGADAICVLKMK